MKALLCLLLVFIIITYAEEAFYETSYNCTKTTKGSVERSVCINKALAKLDKELSSIYSSFYYVTNEIKSDQREWVKQKNKCKDTACIQKAYETRIADLNTSLTNEKTFPQIYLQAMKQAQNKMGFWRDPNMIGIAEDVLNQEIEFKNDFFRFKNIYFKPPLIAEVQDYNDPKLKKILGSCYDYHFEQSIIETDNRNPQTEFPKFIADGQSIEDLTLSVWEVSEKGKKWFFIFTPPSAYLVDIQLCQQTHIKDNLLQALNSHSQHLWGHDGFSQYNVKTTRIVRYKDQDYIFDTDYNNPSNYFDSNEKFSFYLVNIISDIKDYYRIPCFFSTDIEIPFSILGE